MVCYKTHEVKVGGGMKKDFLIGVSLIVRRHVFASKSNLLLMILFLLQESEAD